MNNGSDNKRAKPTGSSLDEEQYMTQLRKKNEANSTTCYIPPVHYPSPKVQQFSDSPSAKNYFSDPSYAEIIKAREACPHPLIPHKTPGPECSLFQLASPSFKLYRDLKTQEKDAISDLMSKQ
jgi:hypothetical protein